MPTHILVKALTLSTALTYCKIAVAEMCTQSWGQPDLRTQRKPDPANRSLLCTAHHLHNSHLPTPETSSACSTKSLKSQWVSSSSPGKEGLFHPLNLTPHWNHHCCPQLEGLWLVLKPVSFSRLLVGAQNLFALQEKCKRLSL